MAKQRKPTPQAINVQGLSTANTLPSKPQQPLVDDFTGEVIAVPAPLSVLSPQASTGAGAQHTQPHSGDQLHQMAREHLEYTAGLVLQQAGLAPRPPKQLSLGEAVQRASVLHQIRTSPRTSRR